MEDAFWITFFIVGFCLCVGAIGKGGPPKWK